MTHLDEILNLHDLSLDLLAGDIINCRVRFLYNHQKMCLHHHVYDLNLLHQISDYFNIQVKFEQLKNLNQIIIGQKK